ncbi:MAG: NAD(P)/FAD-dependent oxidoreductase [Candidatus Woesearchaeota archaeon]
MENNTYGKKMGKKKAIVIGAGLGGLVCANRLAISGLDVTLLEQHDKVGGLSQAWEKKPRLNNGERIAATFELTQVVSGFLEGEKWYKLYEDLGVEWDRIGPFVPAPRFGVLRTADGEESEIFNDFEDNRNYLLEQFPEESDGVNKFFGILDRMHEEYYSCSGWKKKLETFVEPRIKRHPFFKKPLYLLTKPTFVKLRNHTYQDILNNCFKGEDIKAHLSMLRNYVGISPSKASGLLMSILLLSFWKSGGPLAPAESSFQVMHDELARVLVEKHGGDVRLLSKVKDIHVENNAVKGVKVVQRGKKEEYRLEADYVIVAGDAKRALLPLRDHLPKKYVNMLEGMVMSGSLMGVHAIVEKDLFGIEERMACATNVLISSKEALSVADGTNFPEHYAISVAVPTVLRPEAKLVRDLDGKPLSKYHIVDLAMDSLPYENWDKLRKEDIKAYRAKKDAYAQEMIRITEDMLIPGLSDAVRYTDVYTAKTCERFCNVTEGAVYAFEQTPGQFIPNRPTACTPIKGLYLTGSSILAGGVPPAISAGKMTADALLEDEANS